MKKGQQLSVLDSFWIYIDITSHLLIFILRCRDVGHDERWPIRAAGYRNYQKSTSSRFQFHYRRIQSTRTESELFNKISLGGARTRARARTHAMASIPIARALISAMTCIPRTCLLVSIGISPTVHCTLQTFSNHRPIRRRRRQRVEYLVCIRHSARVLAPSCWCAIVQRCTPHSNASVFVRFDSSEGVDTTTYRFSAKSEQTSVGPTYIGPNRYNWKDLIRDWQRKTNRQRSRAHDCIL